MGQKRVWWQPPVIVTAMAVFFILLFYTDNKYQTLPPYGKSGVIVFSEQDLERNTPIFLIDGWLLTDGRVVDRPTYIGEFSNLQRGNPFVPPHGKAHYRLTLRYKGASRIVSVDFPQLFSEYAVSLDGVCLARGSGNGRITFPLTDGDHDLLVETVSELGYYSGMYFPPALGVTAKLQRVDSIRSFAYALAFLVPLALAAYTLFLWRTGGSLSRWFGLFCCCYALSHTKSGVIWAVLLRGAAYCSCFRHCREQGMAGTAGGSAGAFSFAGAFVSADSDGSLGGFCPWQADGQLLCVYILLCRFFHCAGNHGAELGEPLYVGRMLCIWSGAARQSLFFQPF